MFAGERQVLTLTGMILQFTYRLRRHLWLGWSLARWFGTLLLLAAVAILIRWWWAPWPAILIGAFLIFYLFILVWAERRRYVAFVSVSDVRSFLTPEADGPPLRAEELIPVRASGWFTVEGKNQYYMDVEADFETVGTREHIVLGRIHPSRFLWLGHWPEWELGWWYIFFLPTMIRKLAVGYLYFGPQPRLSIQVVYAPDEETVETVYLTFADRASLRRVWEDLQRDAPPVALPEEVVANPPQPVPREPAPD